MELGGGSAGGAAEDLMVETVVGLEHGGGGGAGGAAEDLMVETVVDPEHGC